ncbi:hypothetical protein D3C87_1367050 [compost metagenome]
MTTWTHEELQSEYDKIVLGLQYTIAERERLKAVVNLLGRVSAVGNEVPVSEITEALLSTNAERFQDIFALLLCGAKRDRFFVEFGACDGLVANNTVMLERRFGWKGILAEPDRFWRDRLPANRTALIDNRCVSSATGEKITFYQSDRPGNSSPDQAHPYLGGVTDSYEVETVSFLDLLKTHNAPKYIDFLSVDTEGHEKAVFSSFDFDQYKFGFICVEEHEGVGPDDSVQPIIEAAGYRMIYAREEGRPVPMQITGVDKFFVPKDHPFAAWLP